MSCGDTQKYRFLSGHKALSWWTEYRLYLPGTEAIQPIWAWQEIWNVSNTISGLLASIMTTLVLLLVVVHIQISDDSTNSDSTFDLLFSYKN